MLASYFSGLFFSGQCNLQTSLRSHFSRISFSPEQNKYRRQFHRRVNFVPQTSLLFVQLRYLKSNYDTYLREIDHSIEKTLTLRTPSLSLVPLSRRGNHIAPEISVLYSFLFFRESGCSFGTRERPERAVGEGLSSSRRPKGAEKRQLFRKPTPPRSSGRFTRRGERWCIAA